MEPAFRGASSSKNCLIPLSLSLTGGEWTQESVGGGKVAQSKLSPESRFKQLLSVN